MSALQDFFRSLPHPILLQYRRRYLEQAEGEVGVVPAPGAALALLAAGGGGVAAANGVGAGSSTGSGTPSLPALGNAEVECTSERLAAFFSDRHKVREHLKAMPRTHHVALIALLSCDGIAGGTWLLQELTQAHGMSEDLWAEVLHHLGADLWVFGNSHQSPPLFYIAPQEMIGVLAQQFSKRLGLGGGAEEEEGEVRLSRDTNYRHPVAFSIVSLLTYLRQNQVRMTRKDEIFKKHLDELLDFFTNLWGGGAHEKVLGWHLDYLQDVGLVRQRGGHLEIDELSVGEFLGMSALQRRDLMLAWFRRKEPLLIWLLDQLAALPAERWVAVKKLKMAWRRKYMGGVFHRRYVRKSYYLPPSGFYDPTPPLEVLQLAGLLESGLGAHGPFARLSEAGRAFVSAQGLEGMESSSDVGFLLQPTFEILAPVGLPLPALWRLGAVAQLKRADRASTYVLTRESIRHALDEGWRADEVCSFLKSGSHVGLPQNVESTLRDWVGRHGEVEFHDALVVTARADREDDVAEILAKGEAPFEKLGPGVFAVPREARPEILAALQKKGLEPAPRVRTHDAAADPATRKGQLHSILEGGEPGGEQPDEEESAVFPTKSLVMLGAPSAEGGREAMEQRGFRSGRLGANAVGADLSLKPAAAGAGDLLKLSPAKTISVVKAAIRLHLDLEVLYPAVDEDDPGGLCRVTPRQVEEAGGASWFSGRHHRLDRDIQFQIKRIQGIRLAT